MCSRLVKLLFICAFLALTSACDSNKLKLEAKAGEYFTASNENKLNSDSSVFSLALDTVASESKWGASLSVAYVNESEGNVLQIMLLQSEPKDSELKLIYRSIEGGKEQVAKSFLSGIDLGESIKINVSWDKQGTYTIRANEVAEVVVETNITNPLESFTVVSGSGTVVF